MNANLMDGSNLSETSIETPREMPRETQKEKTGDSDRSRREQEEWITAKEAFEALQTVMRFVEQEMEMEEVVQWRAPYGNLIELLSLLVRPLRGEAMVEVERGSVTKWMKWMGVKLKAKGKFSKKVVRELRQRPDAPIWLRRLYGNWGK